MRRLTVLVAAVALVVTGLAAPAVAHPSAAYPLQSRGNLGVDTLAVQYLLQQHGYGAPSDGNFGASTQNAVKSFQASKGLAADGVVGAATWGALVVTVRSGSSGAAVKALQAQLNRKRRLALAVDGVFGAGTDSAVRALQSHMGIGADGVVGATTWKNLLWHYAYPAFGDLCDQDPDGNGTANWATGGAIGQLEAAARSFAATGQGRVPLGDASFEHGGDIPGHASHEVGLDIDVWPVRTDSAQCTAGRITWQSATYDRAATRQLVQAVRAAAPGHVTLVYFNDPTLIAEGLTTQYPNHDNHLHIRYH
ncbi:penicillin-insensitive murein endopeptidase [Longispora sp. NPDC051575]|uniref:penicillin-insensitive murein endopeptidase n=1 Tax=Longispora sp. NPDC051575 TaxID=3154943 RepID=UPI00341D3707